jgi:transcriptional regulator with XRE-family HTH domain
MFIMVNKKVKHADIAVQTPAVETETMGMRIRKLRESKQMSQERLGVLCGASRSSVSQWETGVNEDMKLTTFLALVGALGTTPHYLVHGITKPFPTRSGS